MANFFFFIFLYSELRVCSSLGLLYHSTFRLNKIHGWIKFIFLPIWLMFFQFKSFYVFLLFLILFYSFGAVKFQKIYEEFFISTYFILTLDGELNLLEIPRIHKMNIMEPVWCSSGWIQKPTRVKTGKWK